MNTMPHTPWLIVIYWLWLVGLIMAGFYIGWDSGVIPAMIASDRTWLSLLILVVFGMTTLHCGWRSVWLAREAEVLLKPHEGSGMGGDSTTLAAELLAEKLRGQHQIGWFVSGVLIKLGLLGTVIGFVIMLASVGKLESLDITQVQHLMQQMTQGMKIALNTTIFGLVSSILLGMQYLFLDRSADKLVAEAVQRGAV